MNRERWRRIEPILDRALELPEERRESYLDEACAGDAGLRAEIVALIDEDRRAHGPLDATADVLARALEAADGPEPAALPEEIGHYRIEAKLGQGGMGIVYRALQQDPDDWRALWLKGAALFGTNRAGEALAPLERACELDSTQTDVLRTTAQVAEALSRPDVAERAWRRLVWVDDEDGEAWF